MVKTKTPLPETGQTFSVAYPFWRGTHNLMNQDEEGITFTDVPTWNPGTRHADKGEGDIECIADGLGTMTLRVVSVHQPGRYPTRVFYTRAWMDPTGKAFGKTKLRMTTVGAFRTLASGYKVAFVLAGCRCEGCRVSDEHRISNNGERVDTDAANHPYPSQRVGVFSS